MHRLHFTDAYVISALLHGESNRVYRLLTRDLGVIFAHGQGVRELRNRNRYALGLEGRINVSLVRGREVWRITGARETDVGRLASVDDRRALRRLLSTVGILAPRDMPLPEVFAIIEHAYAGLLQRTLSASAAELLGMLYILDRMGYVPREALLRQPVALDDLLFTSDACHRLQESAVRRAVVETVNSGLRAAHL